MGVKFESFDKGTVKHVQITATSSAQVVGTLVSQNSVKRALFQVTANNAFFGDSDSQTYPVDANETLEVFGTNLNTLYVVRNGGADATIECLLFI